MRYVLYLMIGFGIALCLDEKAKERGDLSYDGIAKALTVIAWPTFVTVMIFGATEKVGE